MVRNVNITKVVKRKHAPWKVDYRTPDGHSASMPATARLCYIAGTKWSRRGYMDISHLYGQEKEKQTASRPITHGSL